MRQPPLIRRLKSSSSKGHESLIEVFERGLRKDYEDRGYGYQEVVLGPNDIFSLLQFSSRNSPLEIPPYLIVEDPETSVICSLSQRLFDLLPALVVARKKNRLRFYLEIYVNSLLPIFAPLHASLPLMVPGDRVVVNTQFSRSCLVQLIDINPEVVIVRPPLPELCLEPVRTLRDKSPRRKIKSFSRLIPNKGCHEVIKSLILLDHDWELYLYGFHPEPTEYERYLLGLTHALGLNSRVHCRPLLVKMTDRIDALVDADVVVNISVSFEETMGKVILEALSWNKPVIANNWSGFPDLLPHQNLIPTHWSLQDWYHLKASDLALAVQRTLTLPHDYPRSLYLEFLSLREQEISRSSINSFSNPMNHHSQPNWKLLQEWILMPRLSSLRHGQYFLIENSRILSQCFSSATVDGIQQFPADLVDIHPRILFFGCMARHEDPVLPLQHWVTSYSDSPYLEIAKQMLATTKY